MTHLKLHYADLLYGRPCCGTERGIVTRDRSEVTCKRCRTIVEACERATIGQSQVREVRP
jgi:hypothetical protein